MIVVEREDESGNCDKGVEHIERSRRLALVAICNSMHDDAQRIVKDREWDGQEEEVDDVVKREHFFVGLMVFIPVVELLTAHITMFHSIEGDFAYETLSDEFHEVGLGRGGSDTEALGQVANGEHLLPIFCKKREELGLTWVEAAAMEELGGLLLLILFVLKVGAQIAECLL